MSPIMQTIQPTLTKLDPDVSSSWYRWHQAMKLHLGIIGCFEIVTGEITRDNAYMLGGMDSLIYTDPQHIIMEDNVKDPITKLKYRSEFDRRDHIALQSIIGTVSHSLLPIIHKTRTSTSAYKALKFQFLEDSKITVNDMLQYLNETKFNFGDDLKIFFGDQEHAWNMLQISSDENTTLTDDIYLSIITKSMPYQFNQYITQLKVTDNIKNPTEYKKKLLTIYNDINKNNHKELDNQVFSAQKQPKPYNHNKRNLPKQRGGKHFNRKTKHSANSATQEANIETGIKHNVNNELNNIELYDGAFNISTTIPEGNAALLDGGATCHISNKKNWFINIAPIEPTPILTASGTMYAIGKGNLKVSFESEGKVINWLLKDTLYIPECKATLISIAAMSNIRWCVLHEPHLSKATIIDSEGTKVATVPQIGNKLLINVISDHAYSVNYLMPSLLTWHQRLSHINIKDLKYLLKTNYKVNYDKETFDCDFCEIAKSHKHQYPSQTSNTKAPLELIHSDIIGPLQNDKNNNRYVLTIIDDYTRYAMVCLLKDRVEAITKFEHYKKLMETRCERKIKSIRVDRAPEFTSNDFKTFLTSNGIELQLTAGYSPQSNGLAERYNRTLIEGTRANLYMSRLPEIYWGYALLH